jgi:hypothetical protein
MVMLIIGVPTEARGTFDSLYVLTTPLEQSVVDVQEMHHRVYGDV